MKERILTYAEAIREATEQEMSRDPRVILFGMGVDDFKGTWGTTKDLHKLFGPERVFDTPLSEDALTGFAIGASVAGLRPIHMHIRMDFLILAMNQLINMASKMRSMYGGQVKVPVVVRGVIGRSWGQGAQHSQGLHAFFAHVPGFKVVLPSTPYDAKGCLIQAIRDDNPVMFIDHRMLHAMKGNVPEEPYTVPFGQARIKRIGSDITLVGISYMLIECLRAAELLKNAGISAEVIDPVSIAPLDLEAIVKSVRKTGRLIVVDTDWTTCGIAAAISAGVAERLEGQRDFKVRRMGFSHAVCPPSKPLEELYYPNPRTISQEAFFLVNGHRKSWTESSRPAAELAEFKGPF